MGGAHVTCVADLDKERHVVTLASSFNADRKIR